MTSLQLVRSYGCVDLFGCFYPLSAAHWTIRGALTLESSNENPFRSENYWKKSSNITSTSQLQSQLRISTITNHYNHHDVSANISSPQKLDRYPAFVVYDWQVKTHRGYRLYTGQWSWVIWGSSFSKQYFAMTYQITINPSILRSDMTSSLPLICCSSYDGFPALAHHVSPPGVFIAMGWSVSSASLWLVLLCLSSSLIEDSGLILPCISTWHVQFLILMLFLVCKGSFHEQQPSWTPRRGKEGRDPS